MLLTILLVVFGCDFEQKSVEGDSSNGKDSSKLQKAWNYDYQIEGGVRTAPKVTDDSLVLVSAGARLVVLDVAGGSLEWRSSKVSPAHELYCRELLSDESGIYGSHTDRALAWNRNNWNKKWKFSPPSEKRFFSLGYFSIGPEYFYGSGDGGRIFLIDKRTGKVDQEHQYQFGAFGLNFRDGSLFFTQAWTPEGAEGQSKGGVMKITAANGDSLWNYRTERGGFYRMRPLLDEGRVYAGTRGGEMTEFVALDAQTGEVIWRNKEARVYAAEMAAGKIFVNTGRDVMALDKKTGETLWHAGLEAGHGESGLAYLEGYVYHPHGQGLCVINAKTGEVVHIEWPENGYFWEVGTGAGKVFAQDSGALYAFEPYSPE